MMITNPLSPLVFALPKGRIAEELEPLLNAVGIIPEASFFDEKSRQLQFATNLSNLSLIRVRSFDVATFVAFGAAHVGVAGKDVLMEFNYSDLYAPLDLQIGQCRLSVAEAKNAPNQEDLTRSSHLRIATKYPSVTKRFFATKGIQAECVKLHGAMELAPSLGLCQRIVDLVGTGKTLRENGLVETETIAEISSHLIINRTSFKTRLNELSPWIEAFRKRVNSHG